jgi:hypothetical protein
MTERLDLSEQSVMSQLYQDWNKNWYVSRSCWKATPKRVIAS